MQILNLSATINVASLEPSINTYRLGEGAGTYEYPELNNKPKINGVTLVGNISSANLGIKTSDLTNDSGFISEADIPTATSDLTNDSGFVNATQVQSVVAGAIPSDISYFNNDVGYITNADIGNIPTKTSQLINDSGYITGAEAPVVSVNNMTGAVVLDGSNIEYEQNVSLNSKINAVEGSIPTATSQLENDSGYITNANIPTRTSQLVNDSGFVNSQNIPVQSVNGKTGAVELTAADIDYDSNNTVAAKIDAVEDSIPTRTSQLVNDSGFVNAQNIIQTGTIENVAIASFSDGAENVPVSELIVDIKAVQAGSGDPSPSNPRAISGFDSGIITVTDNGQATNTYTVNFGQTVYGGYLNVTTGELKITNVVYVVDGTQQIWKSTENRFYINIPNAFKVDVTNQATYSGVRSEIGSPTTWGALGTADGNLKCAPVYGNGIAFRDDTKTTVADWVTYFTNNTTKFTYELATPTEIQLNPVQVKTLLNNNNISANTGNIEKLVYFKTGCEAIAKLIEAMVQ